MDRDRDTRLRDIDVPDVPPEDRYHGTRGQSYRPGNSNRSPPRMNSYRARSPPRRPDYTDSYRAPRGRSRSPARRDDFRRRSPSPRYREREPRGADSYRARPRSPLPPRREDLPRDDLFRRDAPRDGRDFRDTRDLRHDRERGYGPPPTRSPPRFRERSPLSLKRGREPSPIPSRGRRTPPPARRERLASPPRSRYDEYPSTRAASPPPRRRFSPDPRDRRPSPSRGGPTTYRPRSRSPPPRNDRADLRGAGDWRRAHSPASESRQAPPAREGSGQNSGATSRRSSPPIHPSRLALQPPASEERITPGRGPSRDPYEDREPYRAGNTDTGRAETSQRAGPAHQDESSYHADRERVPPRDALNQDGAPLPTTMRAPPTGPGGHRAASTSMAPPTGPASVSAVPSGPRGSGPPPSGPRGAPAARGDYAPRGRGSFSGEFAPRGRSSLSASFRGGRGGTSAGPSFTRSEGFGRGGSITSSSEGFGRGNDTTGQETSFANRPPTGPRGSLSQTPTAPAYRPSGNTGATTFPRSQRFAADGEAAADVPTGPKASRRINESAAPAVEPSYRNHPMLQDMPKLLPEGEKLPDIWDRTKQNKLEEETEKLRAQAWEKEEKLRKSLRQWDRMTHDVQMARLKSELAEENLRKLNGEAEAQAAF